jgi:hypothetical protein
MAGQGSGTRKDRLAAALRENLKRRKAQVRAKATRAEAIVPPNSKELAAAPQAGLDDRHDSSPKSAPKRH